jgi:peptidoglycan/xylan/chitin deacetylase (PgdA/CDA1 family)
VVSGTSARAGAHWVVVGEAPARVRASLRVPILMYHRVVDPALAGRSLPQLVVPPRLFAAQMTTLWRAGWRTIDTATLAADLATGILPPPRTFVVSFDDGYADGFTEAYPILKHLGFVATYYVVTGRLGRPDQLTRDQLSEMAAAGMEIGDHTVDHVNLTALWGRTLRHEIDGARSAILRTVGEAPVSFAYPFGDMDARVVAAIASAGFEIAVTNREGIGETWANRFNVPRLRVGPATSPADLLGQMALFAND